MAVKLEVSRNPSATTGGHAVVRFRDVALGSVVPQPDVVVCSADDGQHLAAGKWHPARAVLKAEAAEVTNGVLSIFLGPDIVDFIAPGTGIEIELPALGMKAEGIWPADIPTSLRKTRTRRRAVVTDADRPAGPDELSEEELRRVREEEERQRVVEEERQRAAKEDAHRRTAEEEAKRQAAAEMECQQRAQVAEAKARVEEARRKAEKETEAAAEAKARVEEARRKAEKETEAARQRREKPPVAAIVASIVTLLLAGGGIAGWQLGWFESLFDHGPTLVADPNPASLASIRDYLNRQPSPSLDKVYGLAKRWLAAGNAPAALSLFEFGEGKGHGPSIAAVGRMYDPSVFSPDKSAFSEPNARRAVHLYKRAAEEDDPDARSLLEGLKLWLTTQANNGDPEARTILEEEFR